MIDRAHLMARAWNSSTELHTATTLGAAKLVAIHASHCVSSSVPYLSQDFLVSLRVCATYTIEDLH